LKVLLRNVGTDTRNPLKSLLETAEFRGHIPPWDFLNTKLTTTPRGVIKIRGNPAVENRSMTTENVTLQLYCLLASSLSYTRLKINADTVCLISAPQNNVTCLFYYVTQLWQMNSALKLAICLLLQAICFSKRSRTRRCVVLN
jgi:hypothetical protein